MAATTTVHLPEEVITEILLRLPVKILLRCRCVCKSWRSLISHDSNFATSHFQLSASPTQKLLFINCDELQTLSIDFNSSLNDHSSLSLHFLSPEFHPTQIGGSCRGFLFLHSNKRGLYIWNPSTSFHTQIPDSPITIAQNRIYHSFLNFLYGFAYEPSTDDYLIVFGSYSRCRDNFGRYQVSISIDLEIFSVRANNWKQIGSHLPYMITHTNRATVGSFLNGAIHWLVYNHETKRDVIVAFDLKEMRMSEIALPPDFVDASFCMQHDLSVLGGLINAWIVDMGKVEIWVMQEYAVHSSWTKTLVFECPILRPNSFFPICSTNCGDIVGTDHQGGLVRFNDRGHFLEHHTYYKHDSERSQMAVYTESLLSLPGGTEQA